MAMNPAWKPVLVITLFLACPTGHAHFNLDINIRTVHVVHTGKGLEVYMRLPTPLFLADFVDLAENVYGDDIPDPAPFTYNRIEDGELLHYMDLDAIRQMPFHFASFAARGQVFAVDGEPLKAEVVDVGLHPVLEQPPFASLEEARRAMEEDVFPYDYSEIYAGATVTDLLIRYPHDGPVGTYTFHSTFYPGLEGQSDTANLILDHFPGNSRLYSVTGLLNEPVTIRNSEWSAVFLFVRQGIIHILEGLDHVLFILCLTLGATGLVGLLWRVTGFTLGHTATLVFGFLGHVPGGAWFIPAVETAIALTIIYAALMILVSSRYGADSVTSYAVTAGIGLVHGLGFSFVLHELLSRDSPHLLKSLISFNVGVEIGQVLIVVAVWTLLLILKRLGSAVLTPVRWTIALPCMAVASYWAVERVLLLSDTLAL